MIFAVPSQVIQHPSLVGIILSQLLILVMIGTQQVYTVLYSYCLDIHTENNSV